MSGQASDVSFSSKSLFIRAGAGAGKTTQLIKSFGEFVEDFHRKHKKYPRIVITTFTRKATQEVKERLLVNALKNTNREVFEYINKKSSVHISTIHGLLSLFLSQNADVLSLPQDLKIVDQNHADRALRKAIHGLMKKKTYFTELLESYPFYRLVELSRSALDMKYQYPDLKPISKELLQNQFEKKRLDILKDLDSIFELVKDIPEKWKEYFLFLSNYQSLLRDNLIEEAILLFEDEPKKPSFLTKNPPFDATAHILIEEVRKEKALVLQDTEAYRLLHTKLNDLFADFLEELHVLDQGHKKRSGELTISDLENYSLRLIRYHPEVAQDFSSSWDFFMIDEYQDTSPLQVQILNQIVGDRPCFIVGDPQQSIYLFRGARSEVFNQKEEELRKKNVEIRILNTNYRSDPPLMNFVNEFFKPFQQTFTPMNLKESFSGSKLEQQAFFIQTHDQTKATLKHIQQLLEKGVSPQDICVLSRKNADLADIAQQAYHYHIPVQLQAAGGFELKREVLDLVAFLKFLVNPYDSENLVTLLRSPWVFVEDQDLVQLAYRQESAFSLWSQLLQSGHQRAAVLQRYLQEFEQMGVTQTLKKFILESGFLAFSELLDPTGKREANIWKFLTTLAASEKRAGFSLALFIEDQFTALQSDLGSSDGEAQPVIQPDKVSLMTVHASKGLEFKHVIVIGLTDRPQQTKVLNLAFDPGFSLFSLSPFIESESKLMPSAWSNQVRKEFNQRELLESERVLYVAMTRAQQSVTLVAAIPRPDERSPIFADSWYRKINWPQDSTALESFSVRVEFYDDRIEALVRNAFERSAPRARFFEKTAATQEHHSVTEILSEGIPKTLAPRHLEMNIKALKKAQRGTDLHRLFESLKYLDLDQLRPTVQDGDWALIDYLFQQKEIDLKKVLAEGHNEWGFGLRLKSQVLQGQIDAWAELENEVHVLDYKTGSPEYSDKAFEQLSIYTYALLKMKQISTFKKIVHSVIYPVDQKIVQRSFVNASEFEQKHSHLAELFKD